MIGFFANLLARTAELAVSQVQSQQQQTQRKIPAVKMESTDEYRIDDTATLGRYWGKDSETFSIPEGIQKLGSFSFDGHKELTEIEIPSTVQEIGYRTFYNCSNLTKIKVSPFNPYLCDIDGILYDKLRQTLICCPPARTSIHIPASVTNIKYENAFATCHNLIDISIDRGNKKYTLVDGVLYERNALSLTKLVRCPADRIALHIPDSITEICYHAFEDCKNLMEIDIPSNVTTIGGYAFKNCHSLERVKFPKSLNAIGDSGFRICKSLKEVILPHGTETIIAGTFNECSSLEKIVIPDTVKFVGYIVSSCPNLKTMICHGVNVPMQDNPSPSGCLYMIVNKKYEEKIHSEIKYDILYQLHQMHPNDVKIEHAVKSAFVEIIKELTTAQNMDLVEKYFGSFSHLVTLENIDEMIFHAIDSQAYEIQVFLTNYKYEHFDFQAPEWKL